MKRNWQEMGLKRNSLAEQMLAPGSTCGLCWDTLEEVDKEDELGKIRPGGCGIAINEKG